MSTSLRVEQIVIRKKTIYIIEILFQFRRKVLVKFVGKPN